MRVQDIMSSPPITVLADAPLVDALDLMVTHRMSGLPVLDHAGVLIGMLSEGDVLRRVELGTATHPTSWFERMFRAASAETYRMLNGRKVSDVTSMPAVTIEATAPLADAAATMERFNIKRLAVLRDGDLVGILSRADFVKALRWMLEPAYEEPATSDDEIEQKIVDEIGAQAWAGDCAVEVQVSGGRVILRGSVPGEGQRQAVVVAAENVNGVRAVVNELTVADQIVIPLI